MAEEIKSDRLYEILKKDHSVGIQSRQVLNEADIANEFGVSRTPVRKAFEQLKMPN